MPTGHDLPSARHLADLHGFFKRASFNKDGTADLIFQVPAEMKHALLDISTNDGMALNLSVWETAMPEGEEWLAEALGIGTTEGKPMMSYDMLDTPPKPLVKVKRAPQG